MDVNLEVLSEKPVKRELYNFKDRESQNILSGQLLKLFVVNP